MGYKATGSVDLTSTFMIDEAVKEHFIDFITKNQSLKDSSKGKVFLDPDYSRDEVLKDLASYAGFDLSDSEFYVSSKGNHPNKSLDTLHTLRINDNWSDDNVRAVLTYLASLGMGIHGEFRGEDELEWTYSAEFGSGVLLEDSLVNISLKSLTTFEESSQSGSIYSIQYVTKGL